MVHLIRDYVDRVTGAAGYAVIHDVRCGVASGGLRMAPGCSRTEVAALAKVMSAKEALGPLPGDAYEPLGGAKGGIDFDPRHPAAAGVLARFFDANADVFATTWAVGGDLGIPQEAIERACRAIGLSTCVEPVLRRMPVERSQRARTSLRVAAQVGVGGIRLPDLVGGFGVSVACESALAELPGGDAVPTCVVQGFGAIGAQSAVFLAARGFRVLAVADSSGWLEIAPYATVADLVAVTAGGLVNREQLPPGVAPITSPTWAAPACDVFVAAGPSRALTREWAEQVRTRVVVEGANLPACVGVRDRLHARGIVVVPDVVAASSTNSWWWWVVFGDIPPTLPAAADKITDAMRARVPEVMHLQFSGLTPDDAVDAMTRVAACR